MSERYPGGFVTQTPPTPSVASAQGIWTLEQAAEYIRAGTWPIPPDPLFEYVTLLLPGNGTNGAQNNTFIDSSSNGFTITRNGNTTQGTFSPYGSNWSNYFDGNGDYSSTLTSPANFYFGTGDFTVEAWVFHAAVSEQCVIYYGTPSSGSIAATDIGWAIDTYNNIPRFFFYSSSTQVTVSSGQTMVANQWVHYAVSRSGSSIKFFINGQQAGSTVTSSDSVNTKPKFVARIGLYGPYATDRYFNGYISNLRVVKGTALYTSNFTVPTSPLAAVSNTAMLACSANGFTGTSNVSGQASNAVYSSTLTSSGVFDENYPATAAFDGSLTTAASGRDGGETNTWNATPYNLTATTSLRIYSFGGGGNWYVNGSNQGTVSSSGWYSYTGSYPVTITQIQTTNPGSTGMFAAAIEVDGVVLTNKPNQAASGNAAIQRFSPFSPTASYSTSTIGGSGYFDGTSDYLSLSVGSQLSFGTGDFTIEAWVYVTNFITDGNSIAAGVGATNGDWMLAIRSNTNVAFGRNFTSWDAGTNGITLSANTWYYVAVCRSAGTLRIFVDGTSYFSGSNSTSYNIQNGNFAIGARQISSGSVSYGEFFNGYISNLRILKGTALYTSNFTPPTAPVTAITNTQLLAYFTNAGIIDNSMMNNLETVGNAQISTAQSKFGGSSLYFDGTGDDLRVVNAGVTTGFGTGDFTVEFWVYANSWSTYNNLVDFRKATDYFMIAYTSGAIQFYNNGSYRINGGSLSTTTWYHVAVCRSGTSTKMFVNGTQVGSTYTDSTNYPVETVITIGARNDDVGNPFNGYIDDLRITKGYARYTANFTPPTQAFQTS